MDMHLPEKPLVRYAKDFIVHGKTKKQALFGLTFTDDDGGVG
jgi:hypothetical protein